MKSTRCILSIILGLLAGWLPLGAVTVLKNLQVEYQTNPLGIDVSQPRFNWQMESDRYGACGQAYRLWVADNLSRTSQCSFLVVFEFISMIRERFFPGNRSA